MGLGIRGSGWIAADVYRERNGFGLNLLHLIWDACPPCARVFAIGRREGLPEKAGTRLPTGG